MKFWYRIICSNTLRTQLRSLLLSSDDLNKVSKIQKFLRVDKKVSEHFCPKFIQLDSREILFPIKATEGSHFAQKVINIGRE